MVTKVVGTSRQNLVIVDPSDKIISLFHLHELKEFGDISDILSIILLLLVRLSM